MSGLLKFRVLFYVTVIAVHVTNILYMGWFGRQNQNKDEKALEFKSLEYRFFTTWNFMLQISYSVLGLACDFLLLKNSKTKDYKLPEAVGDFREIVFSGLVWPSATVTFGIFWGLYSIDRALIYPEFLDAVIPTISNHVIHTFILPVAIFEVIFRPRIEPETHARNVAQLSLHLSVYLCVLLFTYKERGIWLYPIFKKLFGTMYFPLALAGMGAVFFVAYYLQWPLTKMIHPPKVRSKPVKKPQQVDLQRKKKK